MVYVVQNYLASFGLCPSSRMWKFYKDHNVSETGSISVLRWMGQGRPTQLGPSETLWSFVKLPHTRRWIESKRSQIVLYEFVLASRGINMLTVGQAGWTWPFIARCTKGVWLCLQEFLNLPLSCTSFRHPQPVFTFPLAKVLPLVLYCC
jgi:hypothetical protein